MSNNEKLIILNLIKENKAILFGKFSSTLTHEDKMRIWKDLAAKVNAMGICNKD